jgi:hypothetical protein
MGTDGAPFSASLRTYAEDLFGRSGTRTKRQPSGSKASASEDALIWHKVIPGHREAMNPESITTATAMLRGSSNALSAVIMDSGSRSRCSLGQNDVSVNAGE